MATYRQLDAGQIIGTMEALRDRIGERFPESNLRSVAEQMLTVARETAACVEYLRRPNWKIRTLGGVAIAALALIFLAFAGFTLRAGSASMSISDLVQGIEAAVNDVVFFGIAVYFLMTIEIRIKRRRALALLHQLRSLAHIIDMHQLTKDPERLSSVAESGTRTSGIELGRYLDFCSELLSLTSKIAALLVQHFNDGIVLAGVNEIEALTTGLSGKIWQKITILERAHPLASSQERSSAGAGRQA
jgi:hypothetical protein